MIIKNYKCFYKKKKKQDHKILFQFKKLLHHENIKK